jgi:predicted DNA-binding WGR domain protein
MSDHDLGALERQWLATGDDRDEARYLNAKVRAGLLFPEDLRSVARTGHPAVREVVGEPPLQLADAKSAKALVAELASAAPWVLARGLLACAEEALRRAEPYANDLQLAEAEEGGRLWHNVHLALLEACRARLAKPGDADRALEAQVELAEPHVHGWWNPERQRREQVFDLRWSLSLAAAKGILHAEAGHEDLLRGAGHWLLEKLTEQGARLTRTEALGLIQKTAADWLLHERDMQPLPEPIATPANAREHAEERYLECGEGGAAKFWEVTIWKNRLLVRYGKVGQAGRLTEKDYPSEAEARKDAVKKIAQKQKQGYAEVEPARDPEVSDSA